MTEGRYANIIVDISHEKVDRPFQYKIPEKLLGKISAGMCVLIPFGKGNHLRSGYVIEVTERAEFPEEKQKEIVEIAAQGIPVERDAILLAAWMKKTYGSTMIAALKTVLPVKRSVKHKEKRKLLEQEYSSEKEVEQELLKWLIKYDKEFFIKFPSKTRKPTTTKYWNLIKP